MKRILTLMALLVGVSANAAQINWGLQGAIKFDGTSVGTGATLQLVCLDGITTEWSKYALQIAQGKTTEGVVDSRTTIDNGTAAATGKSWAFTWSDTKTDLSSESGPQLLKTGVDFGIVATTIQDGKTYYWASSTYDVSDSSSNYSSTTFIYTMQSRAAADDGPNSNWQPIPEPSVALMGLLGIGMLIRRRKA